MGFLPPLARHVLTSPTAMQATDVKPHTPLMILPDAGTQGKVKRTFFGPSGCVSNWVPPQLGGLPTAVRVGMFGQAIRALEAETR